MVFSQGDGDQKENLLLTVQSEAFPGQEMGSTTNMKHAQRISAWIKKQTNKNLEKVYYGKLQVLSYSVYS